MEVDPIGHRKKSFYVQGLLYRLLRCVVPGSMLSRSINIQVRLTIYNAIKVEMKINSF